MWRHLSVVIAVLVLTTASPKPYYQQHYQYQEQSESYKNNELQHKKEEAGRYSKIDDGVSKPLEKKAFHQAEYHAPGSDSQSQSYTSSLHNQNGGLAIPDITNQHLAHGGSRYLQTGSQNVQPAPTSYRREWSSQSSFSSGQSSIPTSGHQQIGTIGTGYDSTASGSQINQERVRSYSAHDQTYGTQNVGLRPVQSQGYYRPTSDSATSGNVADQRSHSYFNSGSNTRQYEQNPGLTVYPATNTGSERVSHQTSRSYSASQSTNSDGTAVYSVPQNSGIRLVPVVPVSQINTGTTAQNRRTFFQSGNDDTQKIYTSQPGVHIVPVSQIDTQRIIPVDQVHSGTTHQAASRQYSTYQSTGTGNTLKTSNTDDVDCDDDTTGTIGTTSGTDRNAQSRRTYFVSGTPDNLRSGSQTNPTLPATGTTVTHQSRTNQQTSRSYISQPSVPVPQDYRPSRGPVPYPGYRALSTTEAPIEVEGPTAVHSESVRHTNRKVYEASSHVRVNPTTDQRPDDDYDDLTQKNLDEDLTQQTQTGFDNTDQQPSRRRPTVNQDTSYASRQSHRTYQESQNTPQYQPISRPVSDNQPDQQTHRTSHRTYQQRVEKTEFADVPSTVKPRPLYPSQQTQTFDNYDQDLTQQHQSIDYSHQNNQDLSQRTDNTRIPTTGTNQGSSYSSSSSYSKSSSYATQQQQQPQVVFSPVQVGNQEGKLQVYQTMQIPAGTSDEMRRQLEEQMRQQLELKMQELYSQQSSSYSSSQKSQPSFSPLHVGRTGTGQLQVYQTVAIPAGASEETRQRMQQEMRQNLEMKMRELMQQQGYQNIRHISTQPGHSDSTHMHNSGDGFSADCDEQTGGSYSTSYSMSSSSSSSSATGGSGNHYSMKLRPGSTYTIHQPIGSSSLYRSQK